MHHLFRLPFLLQYFIFKYRMLKESEKSIYHGFQRGKNKIPLQGALYLVDR